MGAMSRPTYGDLEEPLRRSIHHVRAKRIEREQMSTALAKTPTHDNKGVLAKVTDDQGVSVDIVVARVEKVREVQKRIMKEGVHYGKVPGTDKDCLLKPGAEILGLTFQLGPAFKSEDRWDGEHLESVVTCTLNHIPTGNPVTSAVGSCSTREKKYAWRNGGRKCPSCGKDTALNKSKDKPEFYCWRKKDGCGAVFSEKDERITSQKTGRIPNPDLADNYNTVRKMACKRAHVAAILFATCASEIFTQDVEDSDERDERHHGQELHHSATEMPGDDPAPRQNDVYDRCMATLAEVEAQLKQPGPITYEALLGIRERMGKRGGPQVQMVKDMSELNRGDDISPGQKKALGKEWNRIDRQVKRYEDITQKPPIEASFDDEGVELAPGSNG